MPSIVIAAQSELVCTGLAEIIRHRPDWQLIRIVKDFTVLEEFLKAHRPDLLISEYLSGNCSMEIINGSRISAFVKNIMILSWKMNADCVQSIHDSKSITGFVLIAAGIDDLEQAIDNCINGRKYLCKKVLSVAAGDDPGNENLTAREIQVLTLVARGNSTKSIADMLSVSIHTVNSHRKNIIKKLHIASQVEFMHHALHRHLI
ncbi:MAG: response regulator transcription factor [Cytophagales bacterium]|nr:response regulator transcription factor [Cytophagales bacterium]